MKTQIKNLFLVPALIAGLGLIMPGRATAQNFTTLYSFTNGTDGAHPSGGLTLSGSTLYGTAFDGGSVGRGAVFKVNSDGTGFTTLHSFPLTPGSYPEINSEGAYPYAGLILSGNTLYGTTYYGGSSGAGVVFKVNTDGTGFTNLHSFTFGCCDGAFPIAGLILSGSTLYGTTVAGGGSGSAGTVFKVNTDGTGYTMLTNFTGSNGGQPTAGLTLSGSVLYGTTSVGGSSNYGTVFKINTDGTGYTVLKNFEGYPSDGAGPRAGLTLSGSTLYGTTLGGGSSNYGTVFKINTDGTSYTLLKNFASSDGSNPYAGLTLSGSTLYGTTFAGGGSGYGTVFSVNMNGASYTVLKNFAYGGSDGYNPYYGNLTLSAGTLYGMTSYGGSSDYGTVFKLFVSSVNFLVAAKNDVVPTLPAGAKFSTFGVPARNTSGEVAFKATLVTGFGGVTSANNNAIYAGDPGAEARIVQSDDFAPDASGTPTAAKFMNFSDPAYNNAGEVAFRGTLKVGIGGVTTANDNGLWSNAGGAMHLVAREGDVAPDTGGGLFDKFTSFALSDTGDVVFLGKLLVAGAVTTSNNTGIWVYDATPTLRKLTRTGDSVLVNSTTKTLKTLTFLPIVPYSPGQSRSASNDGGKLVYKATFTDGTSAILGSNYP